MARWELLVLLLLEMMRMRVCACRVVTRSARHKLSVRINIHHPASHLILHPLHPIHTGTHPSTHIEAKTHTRAHHHLLLPAVIGVGVGVDVDVFDLDVYLRLPLLLLLRHVLLHVPLLLLLLLMVLHGIIIRLLMLLLERYPILLLLHMRLHLMR